MRHRTHTALASCAAGAVAAVALLAPVVALAGGPDSVPLSPEAALTGAVLASDDAGGGGWYNPASLGGVRRSSVQIGASAYSETYTFIEDAAQAALPWAKLSGNLRSLNYTSVPSVLSYTYKLKDGLGLSIGVWTPYHAYDGGSVTLVTSGNYPASPALPSTFTETYSFSQRRDDTFGAVGVGWQATRKLRVGAMLQGAYSTESRTVDVNTSLQTSSADPLQSGGHVVYSERTDQGLLGLRPMLGVQWDATDTLRLAGAVRGPALRVVAWGPSNTFLSSAALLPGVPPTQYQTQTTTNAPRGVEVVEPVRLSGGLRVLWERWTFAAEVNWQASLDGPLGHFKEGWSARAGATWRMNEDLLVGAGLFQDQPSETAAQGKTSLSFAGFTAGVVSRPSRVVKALAGSEKTWDLLTAVAVRGAYGWGTYQGLSLDPGVGQPIQVTFPEAPVKQFEGSISFFTAIMF